MAANPLFTSITPKSKRNVKQSDRSVSSRQQQVEQTEVPLPVTEPKVKDMEPPDKKRKVVNEAEMQQRAEGSQCVDEEDWGDEDEFTADQIDELIIASQIQLQAPTPSSNNTSATVAGSVQQASKSCGTQLDRQYSSGPFANIVSQSYVQSHSSRTALQPRTRGKVNKQIAEQSHAKQQTFHTTIEGGMAKQFTPTPTTAGSNNHVSPDLPTSHCAKTTVPGIQEKELDRLRDEVDHYKTESEKLKCQHDARKGEITNLRRTIQEKDAAIRIQLQQKKQEIELREKHQIEKERQLQRKIEGLETELSFTQKELVDTNVKLRHGMEELSQIASPKKRNVVPKHTTSPKPAQRQSPRTPRKGAFPTKQTFHSDETSPSGHKGGGKSQVAVESDSIGKADSQLHVPKSIATSKILSTCPSRRMKLNVTSSQGSASGPQLVSKLMYCQSQRGFRNTQRVEGVLSLMQPPPAPQDLSYVCLERDHNMSLSPVKGSSFHCTKTPSTARQGVVHQENYALAIQGINAMLLSAPSSVFAEPPLDSPEAESNATLLLPLIEDYLSSYVDMLVTSVESHMTSPSTQGQGVASPDHTVENLSASFQGLLTNGASFANALEHSALNALRILHRLVSFNEPVRMTIIFASGGLNKNNVTKEGANNDKEPVASVSNQQDHLAVACRNSTVSTNHIPGKHKRCQLLQLLVKLANPVLENRQQSNRYVTELALSVLATLSHKCEPRHLCRLQPVMTSGALFNCMAEDDTSLSIRLLCLDLLAGLAPCDPILPYCNQKDDCLLLAMYSMATVSPEGMTAEQRTNLCAKVIHLLSTIVSCHKIGAAHLLETDCSCSVELVKCVVQVLHQELLVFRRTENGASLTVLRSGVMLLHALSLWDRIFPRHRQDVEHQYVELICAIYTLFRELPDVEEQEVAMVHELWDFDQDGPDSSSQDSDEQPMDT